VTSQSRLKPQGSHADVAAADYSLEDGAPRAVDVQLRDAFERRTQQHPPIILEIPLTAVAFRDHRLWHRGVTNKSSDFRQMVSLNYSAQFLYEREVWTSGGKAANSAATDRRLLFSADCASAFAQPSKHGVERNVRFIDGPVNHFENAFGPGGAVEGSADHLWELRERDEAVGSAKI
jgi:hypothetical protein